MILRYNGIAVNRLNKLRPHFDSLRSQLFVIALLALMPVLGLILITNVEQRQLGLRNAQDDAQRLVTLSSSNLGQLVEGTRQLLFTVAQLEEVQQSNPEKCSQLLATLLRQNPKYTNLAAVRADGDFYCSAIPAAGTVNVADRDYFQLAMNTHQFSVGSFIIGRVSRLPSIVFSLPVLGPDGQPTGVVFAALRLDTLNQTQIASELPAGGAFVVIDRNGTILDRFPDPTQWVGEPVPEHQLTQQILSDPGGGSHDLVGLDGIRRLYVYAPIQGTANGIFVAIGIPQSVAYAQADSILARNLIGLGIVTLLALLALFLMSNSLILRPLQRLLTVTNRLASGDLGARANPGAAAAEIYQLGESFNEMAASLERNTAQLRQAEANYRSLVEHIPAITYRSPLDGQARTVYISPQIHDVLGYDPDEWTSDPNFWERHLAPEDHDRVMAEWNQFINDQNKKTWASVYRMTGAQGQIVWLRDEASLIYDRLSDTEILQGVRFDITEAERLQESIRQERDLLEKITQTSPAAILAVEADGQITFANAQAGAILGIAPETAHQHHIDDMISSFTDPDGGEIRQEDLIFSQVINRGTAIYECILAFRSPGNERRLLSVNAAPLKDRQGKVTAAIATLEDITARAQAEQERFKQQQEYQAIFNTVPGMIWYVNMENRILRANRAAAEVTGIPVEELIGKTLKEIFPEEAELYEQENLEVIRTGRPMRGVLEMYPRPSGEKGWAITDRLPYRDEEGKIIGVIVFLNDLTERRLRERELEALVSMASALRSAVTPTEMEPVILGQVLELLDVEGALLARLDPQTEEIFIGNAVGAWTSAIGTRIPPGKGISSRVLKTGEPYKNNRSFDDPLLLRDYFLGDLRAAACIPLVTHREVIGAIWVGKSTDISENDMRILTAIADIAASALHRAALFDQTQTRLQRLMGLHSIDMSITGSLDLRVTLTLLLDQVTTQLKVDAADILLLHNDTRMLEYAAGRGFTGTGRINTRLHMGEGYAGRVAASRQTLQVPDLSSDVHSILPELESNGEHFGSYFAAPLIAKGQIRGVIEVFHHSPLSPGPEWLDFLETLATQAAIAVDNAELFQRLQLTNDELSRAYDATIEGWSRTLELRDHETQGHSQRVMDLSMRLARELALPENEISHFRRGVLLHDIGKMAIPDSVLLKKGPLTPQEWQIMRKHPIFAYELLSPIPYLRYAIDVPYAHHERWNGSGYPRGLRGEQIPYTARIFAVVDVWDALRNDRPYRKSWSPERVSDYIKSLSDVDFDPEVVDAFMKMQIKMNE